MAFGSRARRAERRANSVVQQERVVETPFNEPPRGTAREILDWVGKDSKRAHAALVQEMDAEVPRTSLVDALYKYL